MSFLDLKTATHDLQNSTMSKLSGFFHRPLSVIVLVQVNDSDNESCSSSLSSSPSPSPSAVNDSTPLSKLDAERIAEGALSDSEIDKHRERDEPEPVTQKYNKLSLK